MPKQYKPLKKGGNKGRPEIDLALRLRNWAWVWMVKQQSGLTYDGLDKRFIVRRQQTRLRAFEQIAKRGSSPTSEAGGSARKNLFEKVHAKGAFQNVRTWFESPIWELLSVSGTTNEDFRAYVQRAVADSELFRIDAEDTLWGAWALGENEPCLTAGVTPVYSAAVHYLANNNSLNAIAFLAALYREAHAEFDVESATALASAVHECVRHHWQSLGLPSWMGELLEKLIDDRLLRGRWIGLSAMPASPGSRPGSTWSGARRFAAWYCSPSCPVRLPSPSSYPVVVNSERMRWFAQMRPVFRELYEPVVRFDQQQELSGDPAEIAARSEARQAIVESVKAKIQALGTGPTVALTHAVPVLGKKIRISSLPEPAFCIDLDSQTPSVPFDFEEDYWFEEGGNMSIPGMGHPRAQRGTPVSLGSKEIVAVSRIDLGVPGGNWQRTELKTRASEPDEPRPRSPTKKK